MGARASALGERLGHEAREIPVAAGDLAGHPAEEHVAVGHPQRGRVGEIDLELADAVLVVEREHVPAERVHGVDQLADPGQVVHQPLDVVGRLGEVRAVAHRGVAAVPGIFQHEELGLDSDLGGQSVRGQPLERPLQDVAAAGIEGPAFAPQVAGEPGDVALPREDGARRRVGPGRHLLVVDLLRNPVEGGAGAQLRTVHHPLDVRQRHHLALRHAVHVDVARDHEAHAPAPERLVQAGDRQPLGVRHRVLPHVTAGAAFLRCSTSGMSSSMARVNCPASASAHASSSQRPVSGLARVGLPTPPCSLSLSTV